MKTAQLIVILTTLLFCNTLPNGFVYLKSIDPTISVELKYLTSDNFLGTPVDGYNDNRCIITKRAALALKKIQTELKAMGLGLKVFDAYRPQQAVNHFVRWAKVIDDTLTKAQFYPTLPKSVLFQKGFIASRSGHSRGSTVDLTIIDLKSKKELDMGGIFDLFHERSHVTSTLCTMQQRANRLLLRSLMLKYGFRPYSKEWWHFRFKNEPFPKSYFNFPVE